LNQLVNQTDLDTNSTQTTPLQRNSFNGSTSSASSVTATTATDTVTVTISHEPYVFIPSAFTPNGDGLNDRFEFDILGAVSANVQIWNRWGENVFSNPAQANGMSDTHGWDGTFKGKNVEYDTYTYQLVVTYFDGHTQNMTGTVVVMR